MKKSLPISLSIIFVIFLLLMILNIFNNRQKNERLFTPHIERIAQKYQVSPNLIKAIVKRESKFRYTARGSKGEVGLMQLMPDVVKDWNRVHKTNHSHNDAIDPILNLTIGTWYFAKARAHWKGHRQQNKLALAEYNAGRGNLINKWMKNLKPGMDVLDIVEFKSTREYIKTILASYKAYEKERLNGT